jgi:oligoendopeptidase F
LNRYFGPKFSLDEQLTLEGLRIPHFYNAFYVYKYATGISAAVALSERVLKGGAKERDAYLNFLKGGGSKFPLELLCDAGVDMEKPEPVATAMKRFARLVDELEELL